MAPQPQLPRTEEVPSSYREQFLALHGVPVYFFDEVEKVSRDAKRQPRIAVVTREQLFLADKTGDIKKCVQVRELTAIWHCAPRSADLVLRCADEAAQDTWLVCRTVAAAERLARVAVALAQPLPIAVEAHTAVDKHLLNLEKPTGYTIQINPIDIPQPRFHLVSSSSAVAASAARLGQQQQLQHGMDTAEAVAAASSSGAAAPGAEPSSFEGQSPTSSVPPKLQKRGSLANHEQFFSTPDDAAAASGEAEPVKILAAPPSANKGSDSDATAPQGPDSTRSRASPRASQQRRPPPPPPPPQSLPPATGETRESRRSTAAPDAALPHYSTFTSAGRSSAAAAAASRPKAQPPAPLRPSTSSSAAAAAAAASTAAPLPRSPLTPAAASATTTRFPTSASPMVFPSARAQQPSSAVAPAQGWASSGGGGGGSRVPPRGPSSSSSVFDWPRIGPVDSRNLFSVPVPTSAGRTRMLSVPEHATAAVQDLAVEMQDSIDDLRAHRGAHGLHSSSSSPAWPPASQAQSLSRVGGGGDHGAVFPTDLIKAKRSTNREYLERDGREGGSSSILYALSTERR